jgi:nitrogenase molybdenum-iron protein alpha/beta subunit
MTMMNQIATSVLPYLSDAFYAGLTAGIAYVARSLKNWLSAHTAANTAAMSAHVIDGLTQITESVVQEYNQRLMQDAKKYGVWNEQLEESLKADAVKAVLSQGAKLTELGMEVLGDVPSLVSSLVANEFAKYRAE